MKIETTDHTIKFFISVIGIVIIALVLKELSSIFIPLIIAYFLFFVFSPLNKIFLNKKVPLFIVILLDLALILFAIWIASSFLIESFKQFGAEFPAYAEKLNRIVSNAAVSIGITDPFFTTFSIEKLISTIDYRIYAGGLFTSTFSLFGTIMFIVFFFVFVVSGHQTIFEALKKRFVVGKINSEEDTLKQNQETLFPERKENFQGSKENVTETFEKITAQIQKYIISKFLINLAAGFTGFVILSIFGIDFPIVWGVFIFLFNFIPTIGSAVALILPVLMTLIQFESTGFALLILVIIILMQSVFFNIIEPAIIGRRLNLNPLLILIAVLIWGYIWGIIGMLLAVPLTAIIKIVISNSDSRDLNFFAEVMSQS